ncbi:hypothetical protein Q9233_007630 [Columba guinea]|nr:hypothetical protein Q9233_007630 [Columba guinea]
MEYTLCESTQDMLKQPLEVTGMQEEDSRCARHPVARHQSTQLLGVVLAAAANFLISVSLNIQKCAHLRLACQAEPKPYYMSRLWWCGITLLGLGEVGNFTAYGFAPISLVAPLGCVSVIGSAFISVLFLKKTMRAADILGKQAFANVDMCVAICLASCNSHAAPHLHTPTFLSKCFEADTFKIGKK